MRVTVGISTWNRSKLLDQTLRHMERLQIPGGVEWELLVVNNNCTDDTDQVMSKYARSLPITRLFERVPGKSHACNRLLRAATGELILWTDDDVLVDPDWVASYCSAAKDWPNAAFFGGTIDPFFPAGNPPAWIIRDLSSSRSCFRPMLAINQLGTTVRLLEAKEFPFGANMAFRTAVLREHSFDDRLGPTGKELIRSEDIQLIRSLKDRGLQGVWVGTARVRHYVVPERLTKAYVWKWWQAEGRAEIRQNGLPPGKYWFHAPRWALRAYYKHRIRSIWLKATNQSQWLYEFRRAASTWGLIVECRKHRLADVDSLRQLSR